MRPLEAMYPIVYFDALRLKIRDEGTVRNKAVYLGVGYLGVGHPSRRTQGSAGIYTTHAIKSLHMQLRKIVKNRGYFPSGDAATKLLFLPCAISRKIGRCRL
jgi:transposase-like protein